MSCLATATLYDYFILIAFAFVLYYRPTWMIGHFERSCKILTYLGYYYNMMRWARWDWELPGLDDYWLSTLLQWWYCWLGHQARINVVSEMANTVSSGRLINLTPPNTATHLLILATSADFSRPLVVIS